MSQQCHNTLRVSGLIVKATVPSYNLCSHVFKTFPFLFPGTYVLCAFPPSEYLQVYLKTPETTRQICELMESVNPGCDLTNATGQPAFRTFGVVYSSTCFPAFLVLFSAGTTAAVSVSSFVKPRWNCSS